MPIQIRKSEGMQRILAAIADEFVNANIFFRMFSDIQQATSTHADEMSQSWTFWSQTRQAHLDAAILRLCKIYDQKRNVLGLRDVLLTVKANAHLFSAEAFEARLAGRGSVEHIPLDLAQLEVDIAFTSRNTNLRVKRLLDIRHNYYAHRNAEDLVTGVIVGVRYPISLDDIHGLLEGGLDIVNRYNINFRANSYSTMMVGHDDYKDVLQAVTETMKRRQQGYGR